MKHNIEVAHRLFLTPGKCQGIHGHSMQVTLSLFGNVNEKGIFEGLDFYVVKAAFRGYLDLTYDHHLLLNQDDPWAQRLTRYIHAAEGEYREAYNTMEHNREELPGLVKCPSDATSENLSLWIALAMWDRFKLANTVEITETGTNAAQGWITHQMERDEIDVEYPGMSYIGTISMPYYQSEAEVRKEMGFDGAAAK